MPNLLLKDFKIQQTATNGLKKNSQRISNKNKYC